MQTDLGYILYKKDWKDTSLWIDIFLKEGGKRPFVARGIKRKKNLDLPFFTPVEVHWEERTQFPQLHALEPLVPTLPGRLAGQALFAGLYLNELLYHLLAYGDPHTALWEELEETLEVLYHTPSKIPLRLRTFELRLLRYLGFAPNCEHDARTEEAICTQSQYLYYPNEGFVRAAVGVGARYIIPGELILQMGQEELSDLRTQKLIKKLFMHRVLEMLPGKTQNASLWWSL